MSKDAAQNKNKDPDTSGKDGCLDLDGARSVVLNANALYAFKKALREDIGLLERDLMMKAGLEGARELMSDLHQPDSSGDPLGVIESLLRIYSNRGFGQFAIERFSPEDHVVEIKGNNLSEAWPFRERNSLQREPVCHYTAGTLAGVCERVFGNDRDLDIICIETDCVAQGRKFCRFVVAPAKEMSKVVPTYRRLKETASERGFRLNEEILLKNLELQNLNLSLERQIRKKAGELVRAEENYKSLVDISPDPIIVSDLDGFVLSVNGPGIQMLGLESREDALTDLTMPSLFIDKETDWNRIVWAIEKEGSVKESIATLVNRRGEKIDCQISARFIDLPTGRCIESVIRNMTEARRLIHKVEEREPESIAMKDVLSHDVTKYTSAALQIIEKLRRSPNLSESDKNALEIILKDIQSEFELASAVRDYCWLTTAPNEKATTLNLQSVISDSIEDIKRWYLNRKIKINYDRKAEAQLVKGNSLTPRIFPHVMRHIVKSEPRDEVVINIHVDQNTEGGITYWRTKFTTQDGSVPDPSKEVMSRKLGDAAQSSVAVDFTLLIAQSIAKASDGRVIIEGKQFDKTQKPTAIVVELPITDERGLATVHRSVGV